MAAVFRCLFTPDFLQPTGQPSASQDPYNFSTFHLATHLHHWLALVQDIIRTTYWLLLTHHELQYTQSHTSTQAHCATLRLGKFVTEGQKDTQKLSICQHYIVVSGTKKKRASQLRALAKKHTPEPYAEPGWGNIQQVCHSSRRRTLLLESVLTNIVSQQL